MGEDEEAGSSSCHVFMVEPTGSHHERIQRARVFNISLSYNNKVGALSAPKKGEVCVVVLIFVHLTVTLQYESSLEMEFLDISLTKASSLLLHAIHRLFC